MDPASSPSPRERLHSLDAYRGFVMFALASSGLGLALVAQNRPDSPTWQEIGYHFEHVPWRVAWYHCAFWDLIQPSFMFMVGVAAAFSYAKRQELGQTFGQMARHAAVRSIVLVLLGIFLRSNLKPQTNFTFMDVVTQIGLGYFFLFLLWGRRAWLQLGTALAILVAYWCAFFVYPLPEPGFDYRSVGAPPGGYLSGLAAHWDMNTNLAAAFDRWFLNLFPREKPFEFEAGGYTTLNFIPALATMIFGLRTGEVLRGPRSNRAKFWILVAAGLGGLACGTLLDVLGVCPVVKRIWTPSWTLYSAGWTLLMMAVFFQVVDRWGFRRWTFPLLVVGANSILIYCMTHLSVNWIVRTYNTHFGRHIFEQLAGGPTYEPLVRNVAVLAVLWLTCYWLYRQKIFVRV